MLVPSLLIGLAVFELLPPDATSRLGRLTGRVPLSIMTSTRITRAREAVEERVRGSRLRAERRARCAAMLDALSAELSAGRPPLAALVDVGSEMLPHAVAAVRVNADVSAAIAADARHLPELRPLAAAWAAAERQGASLAPIARALADDARAAIAIRKEIEAELAAAQASSRVLLALPVVGLAFGIVMGADPLGWLLGTGPGRLVLVAGVSLMVLSAVWMRALVRRISA